jgi:hypothetical protein
VLALIADKTSSFVSLMEMLCGEVRDYVDSVVLSREASSWMRNLLCRCYAWYSGCCYIQVHGFDYYSDDSQFHSLVNNTMDRFFSLVNRILVMPRQQIGLYLIYCTEHFF